MKIKREDLPAEAKIIRYCRHSISKNNFLSAEGKKLIIKKFRTIKKDINQIDVFFYSPYIKTLQTVLELNLLFNNKRKRIIQINELHSPKIELILHRYFIDYEKVSQRLSFLAWLNDKRNLEPTETARLANIAKRGLVNSFDEMTDGQTALAVGHDTTISLTVYYYNGQRNDEIKEMNFFDFAEIKGKVYLIE